MDVKGGQEEAVPAATSGTKGQPTKSSLQKMEKQKIGNRNDGLISSSDRASDRRRKDSSDRQEDSNKTQRDNNVKTEIRYRAPKSQAAAAAERFTFGTGPPPKHPSRPELDLKSRLSPYHKAFVKVNGQPLDNRTKLRNLLLKKYPEKGLKVQHVALAFMRAYREVLDPLVYGFRTMEKLLRSEEFKNYVDVRKRPNTEIVMVKGKDVVGPTAKKSQTPVSSTVTVPPEESGERTEEAEPALALAAADEKKDTSTVTDKTTMVFDYGHGKYDIPKEYVVTDMSSESAEVRPMNSNSENESIWNMVDRRPDPVAAFEFLYNYFILAQNTTPPAEYTCNMTSLTSHLTPPTFAHNASQNTDLMGSVSTTTNPGYKPMITQELVALTNEHLAANPDSVTEDEVVSLSEVREKPCLEGNSQNGGKRIRHTYQRDSSNRSERLSKKPKGPTQISGQAFKERTTRRDMPYCSRAVRREAYEMVVIKKLKTLSKSQIEKGIEQINPFVLHMNGLPKGITWDKMQRLFPEGITGAFEAVSKNFRNKRFAGKCYCNILFETPEHTMKAFIEAQKFVSTSWRIAAFEKKMIFIGFGTKNGVYSKPKRKTTLRGKH